MKRFLSRIFWILVFAALLGLATLLVSGLTERIGEVLKPDDDEDDDDQDDGDGDEESAAARRRRRRSRR